MAGKIQGVGGVTLAKISKSIVQIEGLDRKLASVLLFVTDYKAPLVGERHHVPVGVKLVTPKNPRIFRGGHWSALPTS